jgi:hypothetical protein
MNLEFSSCYNRYDLPLFGPDWLRYIFLIAPKISSLSCLASFKYAFLLVCFRNYLNIIEVWTFNQNCISKFEVSTSNQGISPSSSFQNIIKFLTVVYIFINKRYNKHFHVHCFYCASLSSSNLYNLISIVLLQ